MIEGTEGTAGPTIGTKPKISQVTLSLTPVSISGHNIPFSQSVRNLGVFIDETIHGCAY